MESGDLPRLIYLIILLTAISGGFFFRSKLKASELIKQALAWILIALTVLVFYSFRYDFLKIKNRLQSEIFPSQAMLNQHGTLSINKSMDGHFYIYLTINGTPVRFMVDTGASDVVLSIRDAQRIGIDINRLNFSKSYQTANGVIMGAPTYVNEIELSGLKFYDFPVSINNSNMGTSLLGMRFLEQFEKYEFYQDKLLLTY